MKYKELYLELKEQDFDRLTNKLNEYNKKTKESFYKDSYFDTILSDFKNNNYEIISRETKGSPKELLIFSKSFEKVDNNSTITFYLEESFLDSEDKHNLNKLDKYIKKEELEYTNLLSLEVSSIEYTFEDYNIYLEKVNYTLFTSYEVKVRLKEESENSYLNVLEELELIDQYKAHIIPGRLTNYFKKLKASKYEEEDINLNSSNLNSFIVVVEGKSDTAALKRVYPNINTFETHGLGITQEYIHKLKDIACANNKKILIITDPDVPGEIIRKRIQNIIPDTYNKYIYRNDKQADKKLRRSKIGVESLSDEQIRNIFKGLKIKEDNNSSQKYSMQDLINLGVYSNKEKRLEFCKEHNIAYGNNKKVLKQLNDYNINI